jgi:cyanate permease
MTTAPTPTNRCGRAGLALSVLGLADIFLLGPMRFEFIRYMTLCSFLGLLVSLVGLCWKPRKHAAWGVILGGVGTLYLPTIFLPVLSGRA